jgi:hypothetical protein
MTKKLVTILCVLACSAMMHFAKAQITVGAKTGVNLNQFQQPGTTIGVSLGAYGSYQFNSFLTVKLEPQYSLEGGARPDYNRYYNELSNDIYVVQYLNPSVRLHNLTLPLLIEATLPELTDQSVVPFVLAGASYSMCMSAMELHTKRYYFEDYIEDSPLPLDVDSYSDMRLDVSYQKENVTDNYARSQWSLWAGMGMKVKSGERTFQFDVRYRHGLNNLNNLRFLSPGNGFDQGVPGTGGNLFSSTLSINFSMSILNF